jgi:hypothetical protein
VSSGMRGTGFSSALRAHGHADCHLCEIASEPRVSSAFPQKGRSPKLPERADRATRGIL